MPGLELFDPIAVALDATQRLERLDVRYVIGGSLASSRHGEPRATLDVDIVAALTVRTVRKLVRDMTTAYYIDEDVAITAVRSASSFNAVHLASAIKVDFFVAGNDEFERERLALRERVQFDIPSGAALWIDTAEHTILRKLEWYRRGGESSERQLRDVRAIIRLNRTTLDEQRMKAWAKRLGILDLLTFELKQQDTG